MPYDATPDMSNFTVLVIKGLLWGAVGATVLVGGASVFDAVSHPQRASAPIYVLIAAGTPVAALLLSLFVGPIAAYLAWPHYRRGVRSRVTYAGAGTLAALVPFGVVLLASERSPDFEVPFILAAWFALSGAFGGFMAARALQRSERQ